MKQVLAAFAAMALFASPVIAQEEGFLPEHVEDGLAVGISNGSHNGLSVAYAPNDSTKFYQGTLSMSEEETYFAIDTLLLAPQITGTLGLVPYYGMGLSVTETYKAQKVRVGGMDVQVGKDVHTIALRVPVGLMLKLPDLPVQVGMEIAPTLPVVPQGKATMDTALNLRMLL